jgi:hypothetical protein
VGKGTTNLIKYIIISGAKECLLAFGVGGVVETASPPRRNRLIGNWSAKVFCFRDILRRYKKVALEEKTFTELWDKLIQEDISQYSLFIKKPMRLL